MNNLYLCFGAYVVVLSIVIVRLTWRIPARPVVIKWIKGKK